MDPVQYNAITGISPFLNPRQAPVLCKAIAVLVPFLVCLVLYALNIYFAYSLHFSCSSSGLLVFAHLGSINFIVHQ